MSARSTNPECGGKVRYETRPAASFFAGADGLRPYFHKACGGWHLSSQRVHRHAPIRGGRR